MIHRTQESSTLMIIALLEPKETHGNKPKGEMHRVRAERGPNTRLPVVLSLGSPSSVTSTKYIDVGQHSKALQPGTFAELRLCSVCELGLHAWASLVE